MSANKKTAQQRFDEKTARDPVTGCLLWQGAVRSDGYGAFWMHGRVLGAHRASVELATNVPVPAGAVLRHSCDEPLCVEPAHLIVGTQAENARDRVERGRSRPGPRDPLQARLTPADHAVMLGLQDRGVPVATLAAGWAVSLQTVKLSLATARRARAAGLAAGA